MKRTQPKEEVIGCDLLVHAADCASHKRLCVDPRSDKAKETHLVGSSRDSP